MDGRHLLLDLWLEDAGLLEEVEPLWGLLCRATEEAGARAIHAYVHRFEPHGISGFLLLAESHVSIHTWPEEQFAAIDILSCGPLDPEELARRFLKELPGARYRTRLCDRGLSRRADSKEHHGPP